VSRNGTRSNGGGVSRLTAQQTRQRLDDDARPRYTLYDDQGHPLKDGVAVPVRTLAPLAAASISLPVTLTEVELEIRAEGAATGCAIESDYELERVLLDARLAGERAEQHVRHARRQQAVERLASERAAQEAFLNGLPRRLRRLVHRRLNRLFKWVPWALFGADVTIISRAYGLLGPLPLPFHASVGLSNATQLLRAALISFALVFGLRLVGGKLKETVDDVRDHRAWIGLLADSLVGVLVVAGAVALTRSASQMQAALLQLEAGGSDLRLPTSVLFSIGVFLAAVSFACGYFLNEPELEQAADHDRRVQAAEEAYEQARDAFHTQLGIVRATREELRSLDRQEALAVQENDAHTKRRVHAHKAGNVPLYGLEAAGATVTNGAKP
jgi:hypothetical protein